MGTDTGAGPLEMTRFTAEPGATLAPPAGLWLITLPAGTVALLACVTMPTARPAPVIAVVAAACVRLTTLGTLTGAGPVEMTRFTAEPGATLAPAPGFWLITLPAATVALLACVTVPTVRPAPVIAVVAAACVRLTTLGTVTLEITGVPVTTQVNAGASNGTVRSWRMVMTSVLVNVVLAARSPSEAEPLTMTVAGELLVTLTAAAVSAGVPF